MKCDVLTVTKRLARSTLLPSGVAVYASPENLKANEEEKKVCLLESLQGEKTLVVQ